jgi:hypothetical protein
LAFIASFPEVANQAAEFKHYIFEFLFSTLLICSFLKIGETKLNFFSVAVLSVLFGFSTILVYFSVFICSLFVTPLKKKWVIQNILFIGFYLVLYLSIIKPSVYFQFLNWKHVYDEGFLSKNLGSLDLWMKMPKALIKGSSSRLIVLSCAGTIFGIVKRDQQVIKILSVFLILVFGVYIASLLGLYSIQQSRHFLFLIPFLIFIFLASFRTFLENKFFLTLIFLFTVFNLISLNRKVNSREKFENVISEINQSKKILLFPGAQPTYLWYKNDSGSQILPPAYPVINPITVAKSNSGIINRHLIESAGAWSKVIQDLNSPSEGLKYIDFLTSLLIKGKNTVFFDQSKFGGKEFYWVEVFKKKIVNDCSIINEVKSETTVALILDCRID